MTYLYQTENTIVSLLEPKDADDLRTMVSNEQLIKDVGRGLKEESIKLFTNQSEKISIFMNYINNKKLEVNDKCKYICLGSRLKDRNKYIATMQICIDSEKEIRQCIVID